MSPIIVAHQLCFAYEDTLVLDHTSFSVQQGEFVGIIGPNGGGKTTLLKLLMGFLKPKCGSLRILGKTPQEAISDISYVPQNLRYDRQFPISVIELVLTGRLAHLPWYGRFRDSDREIAYKALETVGLTGLENRSFGTLSGGQAQRALIARALVSQPKILLLDEPTASVDSQAEEEIYTILKKLAGSMTILMVTHDLQAAINLVQRVLCVQHKVTSLLPQEVCEHFALGLYHTPLLKIGSPN